MLFWSYMIQTSVFSVDSAPNFGATWMKPPNGCVPLVDLFVELAVHLQRRGQLDRAHGRPTAASRVILAGGSGGGDPSMTIARCGAVLWALRESRGR